MLHLLQPEVEVEFYVRQGEGDVVAEGEASPNTPQSATKCGNAS